MVAFLSNWEAAMREKELEKKLAQLESANDHLVTEFEYIDRLLRMIGFSQGLATVKAVAEDLVAHEFK